MMGLSLVRKIELAFNPDQERDAGGKWTSGGGDASEPKTGKVDPSEIIPDADLTGRDLSGMDLSGMDLSKVYLVEANLSGANLKGTVFGKTLFGANLSGTDLSGVDLSSTNCGTTNLSGTNLTGANMEFTNLTGADLSGADLSGADMRNAGLFDANLSEANLTGVDLSRAGLNGTNLSGANLKGADLSGAAMNGANLTDVNPTDTEFARAFLDRGTPLEERINKENVDRLDAAKESPKFSTDYIQSFPYGKLTTEEAENAIGREDKDPNYLRGVGKFYENEDSVELKEGVEKQVAESAYFAAVNSYDSLPNPLYANEWSGTSNRSPRAEMIQESASRVLLDKEAVQPEDWPDRYQGQSPQAELVVFEMYQRTQKEFADAGYKPDDTITLYRGVIGNNTDLRPLSSWSVSASTAYAFANNGLGLGALLTAEVPVANILSTPTTGFGCYDEKEVVVLANPADTVTAAFNPDQERDENGRWTSGGGASEPKTGKVDPSEIVPDADLRGRDLSGMDLSGVDLSGANLTSANLNGANLTAANLNGAKLAAANLGGANLHDASVWGANLILANLTAANLSSANLAAANLNFADLRNANLNDINLGDAQLREANLRDADLSDAFLYGANLRGASLHGANLTSAILATANLGDTGLDNAMFTDADLRNANLSGSNLGDATLTRVNLDGADLTDVDLSNIDLSGANFSNADMNHVDLNGANLSSANFSSADLHGANLNNALLTGAIFTGANLSDVDLSDLILSPEQLQQIEGSRTKELVNDTRNAVVVEEVASGIKEELGKKDTVMQFEEYTNYATESRYEAKIYKDGMGGPDKLIGDISFSLQEGVLNIGLIKIRDEFQNEGTAKTIQGVIINEALDPENQINFVSFHANIDIGGYSWAETSYPTEESWLRLRESLGRMAADMKGTDAGKNIDFSNVEKALASEDPRSIQTIHDDKTLLPDSLVNKSTKGNELGRELLLGSSWHAIMPTNPENLANAQSRLAASGATDKSSWMPDVPERDLSEWLPWPCYVREDGSVTDEGIWEDPEDSSEAKRVKDFSYWPMTLAFNPDQERDADGRWGSGGGGKSVSEVDRINIEALRESKETATFSPDEAKSFKESSFTTGEEIQVLSEEGNQGWEDSDVRVGRFNDGADPEMLKKDVGMQIYDSAYFDVESDMFAIDFNDPRQYTDTWSGSSNDSHDAELIQESASRVLLGIEDKLPEGWRNRSDDKSPQAELVIFEMYQRTQQEFADAGYKPDDTITLYRGVSNQNELELRPLSSWSTEFFTAMTFAGLFSDGDPDKIGVFQAEVPVANIVSLPTTGFGCYDEKEVVVLNKPADNLTAAFNPDQERDADGKWTSDGNDYSGKEYALTLGGLKPEDFPYGQVPGMVDRYEKFRLDLIEKGEEPRQIKRTLEWTKEQQEEARERLAQVVRSNEPSTRMPMAAFKAFLEDGTLRNQAETGKSGAATGRESVYAEKRAKAEYESFGVPDDAKPEDRPVYGYMAPTRGDFLSSSRPEDHAFVYEKLFSETSYRSGFMDKVLQDPDNYFVAYTPSKYIGGEGSSTYIKQRDDIGDGRVAEHSSYWPIGDGHGNVNNATLFGFANLEYGANQYGDVQVQLKRDIFDHSTITGGDSIDNILMGAPARMVEAADPRVPIGMSMYLKPEAKMEASYVEVQYFKHPTLEDVEKVYFTGAKPTKAIQNTLESAGIEWDHDPMERLERGNSVSAADIRSGQA